MTIARPSPAPAWSSTAGAQSVAMAVHRAHDELATLGLGELRAGRMRGSGRVLRRAGQRDQRHGLCSARRHRGRRAHLGHHAERAPALEKELAQLAAEQQRCRQEGKRVLQVIGGGEARSDMTTKRLAELDARER